jgi:hypothetical protein
MTKQQLAALQRNRAAKTKAKADDTITTINVDLPSDLHRRFKAACVLAGLSFSQAVTQAVAAWADTDNEVWNRIVSRTGAK